MARTTLFLSNRSQAVRLPKAVAFDETVHEVTILAATHTADIRANLERRGLVVVTGHLKEFRRVDGWRTEDWLREPE